MKGGRLASYLLENVDSFVFKDRDGEGDAGLRDNSFGYGK